MKSCVGLVAVDVDVTSSVVYICGAVFPDPGVALHIVGSHTPSSACQLIKRSVMRTKRGCCRRKGGGGGTQNVHFTGTEHAIQKGKHLT